MSVLLLVRHGQASFGAEDYDALSETGHEQSRLLGASLARRGIVPSTIVRGGLRRHEETVTGILEGAGWSGPEPEVDADWDEFDFEAVVRTLPPQHGTADTYSGGGGHAGAATRGAGAGTEPVSAADAARAFQVIFEQATDRWISGHHDDDYTETFPAFTSRVRAALERAAKHEGTVLVVSSGGPIAAVVSHLFTGDASLWPRLNPVTVNSGVTKVIAGRRGMTCVTVNAHEHLDHERGLLTYR